MKFSVWSRHPCTVNEAPVRGPETPETETANTPHDSVTASTRYVPSAPVVVEAMVTKGWQGLSPKVTVDPNKRHGGLLSAIDHENNRYYVAEHYAEDQPDRLHADAYKKILKTFDQLDDHGVQSPLLGVFADPGGAGSQALLNLGDHGIFGLPVRKDPGSVKASIELIRRAAWIDPNHRHPVTGVKGAPHVFFLRSLRSQWSQAGVDYTESRLMWELRQYRQKDNAPPDTPIKELDDLADCARYLELARPYAPAQVETKPDPRSKLDSLSRKANEEFDELVARAKQPREKDFFW